MTKYQCPEGYVQVTDIKVMQKLLLQLMIKFHEVCEKHGLVYNLCGGTLLGAVRHKGFIPWDDDLDVCMPHADYEKFIQIAKTEYKDDFFMEAPGDKNYIYPFVKIGMKDTVLIEGHLIYSYGVRKLYLDIFPVDGYPNLPEQGIIEHLRDIEKVVKKMSWSTVKIKPSKRKLWRKILVLVKPFIFEYYRRQGYQKYVKQFLNLTQKYKFEDCDVVSPYWGYLGHEWLTKDKFLDRVLYDFEGHKFWSVRDYDDWLSRMYGDYMNPPPPEKRVQYHGYKLYVKKELLENLE